MQAQLSSRRAGRQPAALPSATLQGAGAAGAPGPRLPFSALAVNPPVQPGGSVAQLAKGTQGAKKKKKHGSSDWFRSKRERTSFSLTSGTSKQGPHTVPHILKVLMALRSRQNNPSFNAARIKARSGLLPSAGQARKLMLRHQKLTGRKVSLGRLKALDKLYKKRLLERANAKTQAERERATAQAIELNPMSTYGHGRKPTAAEMAGKGERRTTVASDLDKMEKMKKGKKAPKFERIDKTEGFSSKHSEKFMRDIGKVSRGEEDLSELDTSSEEEYSDED